MKKALLFINSLLLCVLCFAQAPQGFNYQGVARNAAGEPVASKTIKVRLSILDKTATGTAVYAETHSPATSANGLFSTTVGSGTVVAGVFANIDWADGSKFLKSEIDINGGNNFVTVATTQMMSVPYALYAQTAGKTLIKNVAPSDIVLILDYVANSTVSLFFQNNTSWKNDILSTNLKIYNNNQLIRAGIVEFNPLIGKTDENTFSINTPINSNLKIIAHFQTINGDLYKFEYTYAMPSVKYYKDNDLDGYGSNESEFYTSNLSMFKDFGFGSGEIVTLGGDCCDDPAGGQCQVFDAADPNGTRPENIHLGATELPNGIDDNCNGLIDEGLPVKTWYRDQDADGYGGASSIQSVIDLSMQGYSLQTGDCFDSNAEYLNVAHDPWTLLYQNYVLQLVGSSSAVHPGATEVANGIDDNCNGQADEGFARVNWYLDNDDDDFGSGQPAFSTAVTNQLFAYTADPSGKTYSLKNTDCNDNNPQVHPNAQEIYGNQIDENCDGETGGCETNAHCPGGTVCVNGQCQ